jgi:hypothetical protein
MKKYMMRNKIERALLILVVMNFSSCSFFKSEEKEELSLESAIAVNKDCEFSMFLYPKKDRSMFILSGTCTPFTLKDYSTAFKEIIEKEHIASNEKYSKVKVMSLNLDERVLSDSVNFPQFKKDIEQIVETFFKGKYRVSGDVGGAAIEKIQ